MIVSKILRLESMPSDCCKKMQIRSNFLEARRYCNDHFPQSDKFWRHSWIVDKECGVSTI